MKAGDGATRFETGTRRFLDGLCEELVWMDQEFLDLHVQHLPGQKVEPVVGNIEFVQVRQATDVGGYECESITP